MKNFQKDFDLLMKNSLGNIEVSPPEKIKAGVFNKLSRYALWYKIKRNSIFILAIILISVMGIFTYKTLHKTTEIVTEKAEQTKPIHKITSINTQENNQNKTFETLNETKSNNSENDNTNNINKNVAKNKETESNLLATNSNNQNAPTKTYSDNIIKKTEENTQSETNLLATNSNNQSVPTKTNSDNIQNSKNETKEQMNSSDLLSINSETSNNVRNYLAIQKMQLLKTIYIFDNSLQTNSKLAVKKINQPLLWSFGVNIGHSIVQNPIISVPETFDDNNYSFNTSLDFPSAIVEMDFRAEKKHFFFDFGIQYSHFSETIKSDNVMFNPYQQQYLDFTGQTTQIDTSGGYFHYFYICDSIIKIIDSVWTWRIDTNMINNFDTLYNKVYDTMNHPEWKNSYTFIEIPFSVGWQYNFGKINIGLKTGPLLSMLIGTKGFIPANISESPSLTAMNSEFKKFRLGLSWQISAVASYFISERMLLEFQPYYRFTIVGIKSTSAYRLKNNSLGLMFGIRYYF